MLLALLIVSGGAQAFTCQTPTSVLGWLGGNANVDVVVQTDRITGKNQIVDLNQINCKNDSTIGNWIDILSIEDNGLVLNPALFNGLSAGVTISGKDYISPVPKTEIFRLLNQDRSRIPAIVFFQLSALGRELHINKGDYIGKITLTQENNSSSQTANYTWTFYAANEVDINPANCNIQSGNVLNIDFGQIERGEIVTSGTSLQTVTKNLTLVCNTNNPVDFEMGFITTPASWNSDAIATSNPNLGIITQWNGVTLTNGDTQQIQVVNGNLSIPLSFTPVHSSSVSTDKITTGAFNASATLVITKY